MLCWTITRENLGEVLYGLWVQWWLDCDWLTHWLRDVMLSGLCDGDDDHDEPITPPSLLEGDPNVWYQIHTMVLLSSLGSWRVALMIRKKDAMWCDDDNDDGDDDQYQSMPHVLLLLVHYWWLYNVYCVLIVRWSGVGGMVWGLLSFLLPWLLWWLFVLQVEILIVIIPCLITWIINNITP